MYLYIDIAEEFVCEMCGTCCRNNWLVTLSKESYQRNAEWFEARNANEEFNKAFVLLRRRERGEYAFIAKQPNGACWFLETTNLCRLHREAGHEHLDTVCKTFPRYPMNTSRGLELTLSFSCPAVLKRIFRIEPLVIVRSSQSPCLPSQGEYAAEVFPSQYSRSHPLYYYFELESHFFDIIQFRAMTIDERLEFLSSTVNNILKIPHDDFFGRSLHSVIEENYLFMDEKVFLLETDRCTPEILTEHFLANFIFKKPFYEYGLENAMRLLRLVWQTLKEARAAAESPSEDMEITQKTIMNMEFQYNHNRRQLLERFCNAAKESGVSL